MAQSKAQIAFLAPLTGPESVVGIPMMQAVSLAIEQANARGDLPFLLELVAMDDKARPDKARKLAESVVADSAIVGVVGHKNSGPSAAAGGVYAAGGVAQVTPSSTNSDLANRGWQTFFRVCADNERQATTAANYALNTLQVQRVATVHDGTDYGRPLAESFIHAIEQAGQQVVLVEPIQLGQRDFDETVRRLKKADCDLVYFGLTEIESAYLTRDLRRAGVNSHLFGADGGRQSPFPGLTGNLAEGVYETYAGIDPAASDAGRSFLGAYEARYGTCPIFGPEAYDAGCILIEALRRAGVAERSAILAEVRNLQGFTGATGPISFQTNGNRQDSEVTIWQVIEGKMTRLPEISMGNGD
jgi:branched-chain amino acid transport system substrate-binding protein